MFTRLLSSFVSKIFPAEPVEAFRHFVQSSTEAETAVHVAERLESRLFQLADATGKPGLDRLDFDAALEALLQLERRGVWSSAEIRESAASAAISRLERYDSSNFTALKPLKSVFTVAV